MEELEGRCTESGVKYDGQRPGREALPADLTPLRYEIWPGTLTFGSSQHDTHVQNERAQHMIDGVIAKGVGGIFGLYGRQRRPVRDHSR